MQLRHDDALGAVDHERPFGGHVRDLAEIHILHDGFEILVLGVGAVQFKFCLQRYAVGETTLDTLVDRVTWRVYEVIKELENEVVPRIRDWEVLVEYFEETFLLAVVRRGFKLEKSWNDFSWISRKSG